MKRLTLIEPELTALLEEKKCKNMLIKRDGSV